MVLMLENVEKIIKTPFRAFSMNFTFDSLYQSMSSNLAGAERIELPITVLETVAIPFNYAPRELRFNILPK